MNNMLHSGEEWWWSHEMEDGENTVYIHAPHPDRPDKGYLLAVVVPGWTEDDAHIKAARIVECVNACRGIKNPGEVIPELLKQQQVTGGARRW